MPKVELGRKLPDFSLPARGAALETWSLAKDGPPHSGQKLVIYFYPKDMTSGCTRESQDFRDRHAALRRAQIQVIGISRDSLASHDKFRQKESLPFALLSDPEETVCRLFDVIREKNMYGRKVMGIERSTFLIDSKGVLRQEWRKVKVPGHVEEVLEAAKSL
jgi:thioredoxin-dependent peroxiredoxin